MASPGLCKDTVVLGEGCGDEGCDDTPAALTGMGQDISLEVRAIDGGLDALTGVADPPTKNPTNLPTNERLSTEKSL